MRTISIIPGQPGCIYLAHYAKIGLLQSGYELRSNDAFCVLIEAGHGRRDDPDR